MAGGPPEAVPPPHNFEAILPGPGGPRLVYLQVEDNNGLLARPAENTAPRPAAPAAASPKAVCDALSQAQGELAYRLCLALNDLKQRVDVLKTANETVVAKPESPEALRSTDNKVLEEVKTEIARLKKQLAKLNDSLQPWKVAAKPLPAEEFLPLRPVGLWEPATADHAAAPLQEDGQKDVSTLSQQEINRLMARCLRELKRDIDALNARVNSLCQPASVGK
jgi:hypothetical protein